MLSMHLRQLFRKPLRTILYFMVLVILTAFFCVSLNLYANSMYNLKLADEAYTTIAVMELYADVDLTGHIVENTINSNYAGYHATTVYNYDLEPIINAPSVIKYDLRARYGAYSESNVALSPQSFFPIFLRDIIKFKIKSEDNLIKHPDGTYGLDNEELLKNNNFYVQAGFVPGEIYTQYGKYKIEIQSDAVDLFSYRYKTGSGYERNSKLIMNMNTDNFSLDREFDYSDKLDQLYYDGAYI